MQLTLLTRAYCHLCDEMLEEIRPIAAANGASVVVVDVDTDAALAALFGALVPVLFAGDPADGREVCHYRLDRGCVDRVFAASRREAIEVAPAAKIR